MLFSMEKGATAPTILIGFQVISEGKVLINSLKFV